MRPLYRADAGVHFKLTRGLLPDGLLASKQARQPGRRGTGRLGIELLCKLAQKSSYGDRSIIDDVPLAGCRRGPEQDRPPNVQRMPDVFVDQGRPKRQGRIFLLLQVEPDLSRSKEVARNST